MTGAGAGAERPRRTTRPSVYLALASVCLNTLIRVSNTSLTLVRVCLALTIVFLTLSWVCPTLAKLSLTLVFRPGSGAGAERP